MRSSSTINTGAALSGICFPPVLGASLDAAAHHCPFCQPDVTARAARARTAAACSLVSYQNSLQHAMYARAGQCAQPPRFAPLPADRRRDPNHLTDLGFLVLRSTAGYPMGYGQFCL